MLRRVVSYQLTDVSRVLIISGLMMEAGSTFKTSVNFYYTKRATSQAHLHTLSRDDMKSYLDLDLCNSCYIRFHLACLYLYRVLSLTGRNGKEIRKKAWVKLKDGSDNCGKECQ
jgi:hypothetical protein